MLSELEIVASCILGKTSFALTPTSFFIVSLSSTVLYSTLMTILHCSMLYPHGYCFLNSHPRGRTWLSSPHPTYRHSPPTDNSSQLPRLSLPYGKKPRIHSVSLNAGMVSLNRNIPWIGLRIRCLAHWLRGYWRVTESTNLRSTYFEGKYLQRGIVSVQVLRLS